MCGIAGQIRFASRVDHALLHRQGDVLAHRGPDSFGFWTSPDGRVGFAHRRLAIVDLSPGGHQPMFEHADGTGAVVTFNGELYNFRPLREKLRGLGFSFRSGSDTEVLLAAWRQWGVDCVREFEGMYVFALYDAAAGTVFFARDRAGEKPLYYRLTRDGITFASEVKALLVDDTMPRHVRAAGLNEYLAYGYITGDATMWQGVRRVPPAGRMLVDLATGTVRGDRHWSLPTHLASDASHDADVLADELHALLRESVRGQLMADVPVGVLLSGGVDSSIVAAVAAEVSERTPRTYTARFEGHEGFDEGPYARLVADHLGTEHVEMPTPPASPEVLHRLVGTFDDPLADSSMIPTYLVSQEIRKHATVAIGGDGGDELFGGYKRHAWFVRQEQLRRRLPGAVWRAARAAHGLLPPGTRGRGILNAMASGAAEEVNYAGLIFRDDERMELSPVFAGRPRHWLRTPESSRTQLQPPGSALRRATALDFGTYMVDDVLVKVDRASMLTSLEVRAPLLDSRIIEFAYGRVPDAFRATERARKVLLRRLGARLLPPALDLTRKQGFSVPMEAWFTGEWAPLLDAAATRPSLLLAPKVLPGLQQRLARGEPLGDRLFSLLFLSLWEQRFGVTNVVEEQAPEVPVLQGLDATVTARVRHAR